MSMAAAGGCERDYKYLKVYIQNVTIYGNEIIFKGKHKFVVLRRTENQI